jgi:hypothetical protein
VYLRPLPWSKKGKVGLPITTSHRYSSLSSALHHWKATHLLTRAHTHPKDLGPHPSLVRL